MSGKRQVEEKLLHLAKSMGASVESPVCGICGEANDHTHRVSEFYDVVPDLVCFSMVSAPRCGECSEPMEYLKRGTDWACRDALCKAFNEPIVTGIGGVIDVID